MFQLCTIYVKTNLLLVSAYWPFWTTDDQKTAYLYWLIDWYRFLIHALQAAYYKILQKHIKPITKETFKNCFVYHHHHHQISMFPCNTCNPRIIKLDHIILIASEIKLFLCVNNNNSSLKLINLLGYYQPTRLLIISTIIIIIANNFSELN